MKGIEEFLLQLEKKRINYVHWKSNTNIQDALKGVDDLDILVDSKDKAKLLKVFKSLNFIRAYSNKDAWQKGIFHYVGVDVLDKKLIHIHLHFKLSLGYDYDKCFTLPIVNEYLLDRYNYKGKIFLPTYENEYCILVIRLILKNSLTPFLLHLPTKQFALLIDADKKGVVRGSGFREYLDLKSKINPQKLEKCLRTNYPFINDATFSYCESVLTRNNSIWAYFKAGKKLKKKLSSYRDYGEFTSFRKAFIRLYTIRFYALLRKVKFFNKIDGKKPCNGGRIIAFVGGDGAGKTTTISNLKKTLTNQFAVKAIHVGKPGMTFLGLALRVFSKTLLLLKIKELSRAFGYLSIAVNRKNEFQKACKYRDKGFVVLQDRIPLKGITTMDCPRVHTLANGKYKWLSRIEKKQYKSINGVDLLFVMKLNPEIALQRRPDDNPDELRMRSGQIWNNDWIAPYAFEINTGENNPEEVQKILLKIVWENLNKPFKRTEIIGLNGTGKSTLLKKFTENSPNVTKNIPIKKHPFLILKTLFIHSIPALLLYAKSKSFHVFKHYLHFNASIYILKLWRKHDNYPSNNLILDQGPFFQLAVLYKEGCFDKTTFSKYLIELQKSFHKVFLLTAPSEILYDRVMNRKNSNGRGQYMSFEEFSDFCNDYNNSFDLICKHVHHTIIDTNNISQENIYANFIRPFDGI